MESRLQVKDSNLEYSKTTGEVFWSLPVSAIVLLAEYTTDEGPYVDDYFLVFVTLEQGELYFHTPSFYAVGSHETLAAIKKSLGIEFELQLTGSAEWDSRVMWPSEMAGSKYFQFKPVLPETFLQKVKEKLVGQTLEYSIAKPIWEYLHRQKALRNSG